MEYDGSIRIGTGIDTKGFDEDGKKLEAKSRRLAENISDSSDVKIEVDTSDAKKEIKEVFDDIEKEEKRIEEPVKISVERVTEQRGQENEISTPEELEYEILRIDKFEEDTEYIESRLEDLINKKKSLEQVGAQSTPLYQSTLNEIQELEETLKSLRVEQEKSEESTKRVRTTLLTYLAEAKRELKELSEQGFGPDDAEYDSQVKKIAELNHELSLYTKSIAESAQKEIYGLDTIEGKIADVNQKIAELSKNGFGIESPEMQEQLKLRAELLETEKNIYKEASKTDAQRKAETEKQEAAQRRIEEQQERNLQKENARIQKETELQAKLQAEVAEEQRLAQIRANATVSDQHKVELMERQRQLIKEIDDLKKVNVKEGYADYEDRIAELEKIKQQLSGQFVEEQRLADIKANATVSDQEILSVLERRKELMAEIADMEKANVGFGYQEYEDANKELQEINQKVKDYRKNLEKVPEKFSKMQDSAKKAFKAINTETKKASSLFSTFSSRLKGIMLSLLIFNWISKAFNAMVSGMKKGFENLAGYSSSYAQSVQGMKNAMSTLGNQFAAAFAPIVQMVIPWLNSLIGVLTTAMTYVSQFFAILGGKSTFTKAKKIQDDYNKSLGGTAKAADKARGALADFDDLHVLEKKNDSGGGGSGGAGEAFGDMFEEVPVDYEVQSWLNDILDKLKTLQGIFAQGFWDGLGEWGNKWENIKANASSIKDILVGIWTDPSVLSSANAWIESVLNMLGTLAGSVASIGLTIAENIVGGINQYLDESKDRIKEHLITMFDIGTEVNNMLAELFASIAFVFEAFASEQGQQLTANIIGIFVGAFDGIIEIAAKLARDILNIFIEPFVENKEAFRTALEGFLGVLSEVAGTIRRGIEDTFSKLNEVYDEHFKPFFDSVAEGLSELTEHFLTFWNEQLQPVLDEWAEMFDTLWQEHIQPALDNFIELLGEVADFLKMVWENIFVPFLDWVIQNILPWALKITDGVVKAIMAAAGGIADVIDGTITVFRGVIEFLTGVFTGDWEKAWNGLVTIMKGIEDQFKGIINGILGAVEEMANGVVRAVNKIIEAINELEIENPFTGEEIWSPNLKPIPPVSIPRLATGAVIRGGNPFIAILGDQPAGKTNIEAPLSTIEQALENVMSRNEYARESVPVTINLNYDGETFARLSIPDILSELDRRGYDVSVLGVT